MSRARLLIAVPILCYYFAAHGLQSQNPSDLPMGAEARQAQRLEQTIKNELAQQQSAQVEQNVSEDSRIILSGIKIQGASLLGDIELEEAVSKYVGISLSYEELFEVAMAVESYYRQHNYLARVVLPTQSLSEGVLELEVIESVVTLAEVDKKLEEMPNTRAQMDALIEPQVTSNNRSNASADVALLLEMYQGRTTQPAAKAEIEEVAASFVSELLALLSDVTAMAESKIDMISEAWVPDATTDSIVSNDAVVVEGDLIVQKIPVWHEPLTRRRRFISELGSPQQVMS